jgi:hypothetical protein
VTELLIAEAKDLIEQNRYIEAREILRQVNSPTARYWMAKVDKMIPQYTPTTIVRERTPLGCYVLSAAITVIGIVFGTMAGFLIGVSLPSPLSTTSSTVALAPESYEFVGSWVADDGYEAIFRPEGTGQVTNNVMEWSIAQHNGNEYLIDMTFIRPGDPLYGITTDVLVTIVSEEEMHFTLGELNPRVYHLVTRRTDQ